MNLPPPPPPGSASPPPPPGWGQGTPTGYQPYAGAGSWNRVQPSAGLGKAMIVLYWASSASAVLTAFMLIRRGSVLDDFLNGNGTFTDLDDADKQAGMTLLLLFALWLASAIVTCLWSKRVADNAQAKGVLGINSGRAAGGWFIPIGWLFVGFTELRKIPTNTTGKSPVTPWQVAFCLAWVASFAQRFMIQPDSLTAENAADRFSTQGYVAMFAALCFVAATVFAMRAVKQIDAATSGE